MGLSQVLMIVGATVAGICFALFNAHYGKPRSHIYMAVGIVGISLMMVGFYQLYNV